MCQVALVEVFSQDNWFHCWKQSRENNSWQIMYSINKVSSLAHAHPASRSWVPWLHSVFGVFCTLVCQQAKSHSLQVQSSRAALAGYSQNFLAGHKIHIQQEDVSKRLRLILSGKKKKKRRWNMSEQPKGGRLLLVGGDTHGVWAVLQCLD